MRQEPMELEIALTDEGFARLATELDRLATVECRAVAGRLRLAHDSGDRSEIAAVRRERARLERHIERLEGDLARARAVREGGPDPGVVRMGSRVSMRLGGEWAVSYWLVGEPESDPRGGLLSVESALGRALLGRCAGEVLLLEGPAGLEEIHIESVGLSEPPTPGRRTSVDRDSAAPGSARRPALASPPDARPGGRGPIAGRGAAPRSASRRPPLLRAAMVATGLAGGGWGTVAALGRLRWDGLLHVAARDPATLVALGCAALALLGTIAGRRRPAIACVSLYLAGAGGILALGSRWLGPCLVLMGAALLALAAVPNPFATEIAREREHGP